MFSRVVPHEVFPCIKGGTSELIKIYPAVVKMLCCSIDTRLAYAFMTVPLILWCLFCKQSRSSSMSSMPPM